VHLTRTLALIAVLALAGCTPTNSLATPSLTPPASSEDLLNPALAPHALDVVTEESARVEGTRIGDALQALIDPATIVHVEDASQVAPAQDDLPAYYVVYRTITLDPSVDCLTLAETLATVLSKSGWVTEQSTNEDGIFLAALSAGSDGTWFTLVGGDASQEGQSVVTFQIASPDIVA
jgi:hypothetical protein